MLKVGQSVVTFYGMFVEDAIKFYMESKIYKYKMQMSHDKQEKNALTQDDIDQLVQGNDVHC